MQILKSKKEKLVCNNCGKEIDESMMFCPYCGEMIDITEIIEDTPDEFEASMFMHESDKSALKALKAIPGFTPLLKAFMKIWNERQFRIQNLSSCIKLSDTQMPHYYNMLPPICEKLGIDIPELYLTLDVVPNAWTYGDTKPFITITSGLIETIPDELMPTVLAHECGHIACHHVLYHTMGSILLNGTSILSHGLGKYITMPLQIALYYWMRCSELSADRAATFYNCGCYEVIELCMRLAGYDKDIREKASITEFMQQALEYKELVKNNKWDKTMEFITLSTRSHPFTAVRAYESSEWAKTDDFKKLMNSFAKV